ncbi:MAG: anthranilate synthase component I family protein [Cyanobacteriota bacterium]|nr:anthranilate synthase component I family protein [Cyanobacteriota bacterium]
MRPQPWREALPWRDPWAVVNAVAGSHGAEGLVWLDGDGSDLGRWGRLGFAPRHSICCRGLAGSPGSDDPFAALAAIEQQLAAGSEDCSWMGWLAYEAGSWVEPAAHWKPPQMALLWAGGYSHELVFDLQQQQLWLESGSQDTAQQPWLGQLRAQIEALPQQACEAPEAQPSLSPRAWRWHTDPEQFAHQVEQIRQRISSGDLFQANLTACCETTLTAAGDDPANTALRLYGRLRQHCPAPFAGLAIGMGGASGEAVLCSSPERFLQRDPDGRIETRPIKGTRPRHGDADADGLAAAELVSSPKDRAENVMIVDLLRNDLGRVCRTGSIRVPQLCGLESYRQVHHLTSVIEGELDKAWGIAGLLRACWPGGSISGAPKIRACQRLAELEPVARGPYCGSLFRLGRDGRFDSNIIIRSLMLKEHLLRAHAGCGIVADSDPTGEAEEMGWKLQPLLTALG